MQAADRRIESHQRIESEARKSRSTHGSVRSDFVLHFTFSLGCELRLWLWRLGLADLTFALSGVFNHLQYPGVDLFGRDETR